MMNQHRMKALMGLLDYLSGMQGQDLKAMIGKGEMEHLPDESKELFKGKGALEKEPCEDDELDELLGDKEEPKGLSVSKVEVLGDDEKEKDEDVSDDELEELMNLFKKKSGK